MTKQKSKTSEQSGPPGLDPDLVDPKTLDLARRCCALVGPPPKLTISEWADQNRKLPDYGPEGGQWHTKRTPYLKDPMDACCDPGVKRVVLMFAVQMGKTELELNLAGYHIDYDPCAMMVILPSIERAEEYSKERLAPMLSLSPALAEKVSDPKSRTSANTISQKTFPGGFLALVGANAPSGLASRPVRVLLVDEIDRFPKQAGTEGDPVALAEKRMTNFWNSLIVIVSSPTTKGKSRIESEYENSTQEQWRVPCPSCHEYQPYDKERLLPPNGENVDRPMMACRACGCLHDEHEWKSGAGKWVAQAEHPTTRGFHLPGMASPWLSWDALLAEKADAEAKGLEVLKTFINTRLAESFEEQGETLDEGLLKQRRHYYGCDVPEGVRVITAGVDAQKDHFEVEVVGWGEGKESWGIEYRLIPGDPQRAQTQKDLDEFLQSCYMRPDGSLLPISAAAIDSGYATSAIYRFCRPRLSRYIFAVKGIGGPGRPVVGPWTRQGKNKDTPMWPVGTDASKDLIMSRLAVDSEGPDYCHFPREDKMSGRSTRGYNQDYFAGMLSEKRVERVMKGHPYHAWVKKSAHVRNEPLDCRVYATAALEIRNPDLSPRPEPGPRRQRAGRQPANAPAPAKRAGFRTLSKGQY
jgi:phage terminase large subunit GpA-like protein